jgi:hypothetical protein
MHPLSTGASHVDDRRDHAGLEARALDRPRSERSRHSVHAVRRRHQAGSSETLARSLGFITLACTILYAIPPTSILGAILLTGYLGGAMASHLRIGSPLFSHILFGFYLGLMVWGGLWLRDRNLRTLLPLRR